MPAAIARLILLVLDGAGIGALPDAAAYGDAGADTLGHVAAHVPLRIPTLRTLGLGSLVALDGGVETGGGAPAGSGAARAAVGRMAERSAGKDSVTGHWEIAGIVLDRPFRVYPDGFPRAFVDRLAARVGRPLLGNRAASGTAIIEALGAEHLRTGAPILYTSADSVLQIAAHERVVPREELYRICRTAYEMAAGELGIGRVIARPFAGQPGAFARTAGRHDFAVPPPPGTLLDRLSAAGITVTTIGKVADLFAGRGVQVALPTRSDEEGMTRLAEQVEAGTQGLIFANLVDFDTVYGHRNDVAGFAANLERFDSRLRDLLPRLGDDDLLIITADHGNDPTQPGTDHTREYVPLVACGRRVRAGLDLGTRATFADLGQTAAAIFGVAPLAAGTSFLESLL